MKITISIGPVTILELTLFHTEGPAVPNPNVVVIHHRDADDDEDDEKGGPGDLFGGGKT